MTEHVRAAADVARAEAFRRPPDHSDLSDTAVEWVAPELLEAWRVVARDLDTPKALVPAVRPRTGPDWPAVGGVVSAGAEPDEPECPLHPNSHPLRAELRDGAAVWACAESVIAPIGSLGQDR